MANEYEPVLWKDDIPGVQNGTPINKARLDQMQTQHQFMSGVRSMSTAPNYPKEGDIYRNTVTNTLLTYRNGTWRQILVAADLIAGGFLKWDGSIIISDPIKTDDVSGLEQILLGKAKLNSVGAMTDRIDLPLKTSFSYSTDLPHNQQSVMFQITNEGIGMPFKYSPNVASTVCFCMAFRLTSTTGALIAISSRSSEMKINRLVTEPDMNNWVWATPALSVGMNATITSLNDLLDVNKFRSQEVHWFTISNENAKINGQMPFPREVPTSAIFIEYIRSGVDNGLLVAKKRTSSSYALIAVCAVGAMSTSTPVWGGWVRMDRSLDLFTSLSEIDEFVQPSSVFECRCTNGGLEHPFDGIQDSYQTKVTMIKSSNRTLVIAESIDGSQHMRSKRQRASITETETIKWSSWVSDSEYECLIDDIDSKLLSLPMYKPHRFRIVNENTLKILPHMAFPNTGANGILQGIMSRSAATRGDVTLSYVSVNGQRYEVNLTKWDDTWTISGYPPHNAVGEVSNYSGGTLPGGHVLCNGAILTVASYRAIDSYLTRYGIYADNMNDITRFRKESSDAATFKLPFLLNPMNNLHMMVRLY